MMSHFTLRTQSWTYEGTWQLSNNDTLVITTTKSNSAPFNDVTQARIMHVDGHELIYEIDGKMISLRRK